MGSARVLTSRLVWATTLVFAAAAFVLGYIGFSGYDVMVAALRARHRVAVGISRRPLDVVSLDAIATRVLLDTYGPGYAGPCPTPAVVAGTGSFPLALLREMSRAQQHARIRRQVVVVTHRPEVVRAAEALTDLTGVELSVVETIPDLPDAVL